MEEKPEKPELSTIIMDKTLSPVGKDSLQFIMEKPYSSKNQY